MTLAAASQVPAPLAALLGTVYDVRHVETKPKSTVLVVRCDRGELVAKRAARARLEREHELYAHVLPRVGIRAPRVQGWVEHDEGPWLLVDHVGGRHPSLAVSDERAAVSRWVARLHLRTRSSEPVLATPGYRVVPADRVAQLVRLLDHELAEGRDRWHERAVCEQLHQVLPQVLAAADRLEPAITHGDLAEQNLIVSRSGLVAVDWDKAEFGSPATDLWLVDPDTYLDELRRAGADLPEPDAFRAAHAAGRVLAILAHDLGSKRRSRRRRYLDRALVWASHAIGPPPDGGADGR